MDGDAGEHWPVAEAWTGTPIEWMAFYRLWKDSNRMLQRIFARSLALASSDLGAPGLLAEEFSGFLQRKSWALDVYAAVLTPAEQTRLQREFFREKGMAPDSFCARALRIATAELKRTMSRNNVPREIAIEIPIRPRAAQSIPVQKKQPA